MHLRAEITSRLVSFLQNLPHVNAVWEGGAASWKRVDEWSDIDLQADVEDDYVEGTMSLTSKFLVETFGIELSFPVLQGWPGVTQTFFRLKNTSPFLLIDFAIIKNSSPFKFLEEEIHGGAIVHFDRKGITANTSLQENIHEKLKARLPVLKTRFEIFQVLVEKELNRANWVEAFGFYQGFTLQPLLEAVRMVHSPYHWNFSTRYFYYDLPEEWIEKIEPLYFIQNPADLKAKWQLAGTYFNKALEEAAAGLQNQSYV